MTHGAAGGCAVIAWGVNRLAGAIFDDETRLAPESVIAAAAEATRLDAKPLADPRLIEALTALTSSLKEEARLTSFGHLAARADLKRMLSTLLILADAEREDSAITTRPLAPPIFIAGLPRSGTTFLHGLLAEDPAMIDSSAIRERFAAVSPHLSERDRRLFAASEARAVGHGGIAAVSAATGIAASTIGRGLKELAGADPLEVGRVRRRGGGRKPLVKKDTTLLADLLALVNPSERGDPMSPLRWTCKSLSQLAAALAAKGHQVGRTVVGELLHQQKFSLQANRKTREGDSHADRDAQFVHINDTVAAALAAGEPVISVDTKKKELVGDFKKPVGSGVPLVSRRTFGCTIS